MSPETMYTLVRIGLLATAGAVFLYLRRNFGKDELFTHPGSLSEGDLKNVVGFARMTMKNSSHFSVKHKDARRRLAAAQAELDRRAQVATAGKM